MFTEIPRSRPSTPLLDGINETAELRQLDDTQLPQLADTCRWIVIIKTFALTDQIGHVGWILVVVFIPATIEKLTLDAD